MHGEFNYWEYALGAVQIADHDCVALNYNCDERDLVDGSVAFVLGKVGDQLRHVHLHDLASETYPYLELLGLLKQRDYRGYLSLELTYSAGDPDSFIRLEAALYRSPAGPPGRSGVAPPGGMAHSGIAAHMCLAM